MNLDPPAAPACLPAQAEGLTAAIGATHQHSGTGLDQQKATTAKARHGFENLDSGSAALAEPLQDMQHVIAGMHLSVFELHLSVFELRGSSPGHHSVSMLQVASPPG